MTQECKLDSKELDILNTVCHKGESDVLAPQELIKQISVYSKVPMYAVKEVLRKGLVRVLTENLKKGKSITISGLGRFYPKKRKGSRGMNFHTKEVLDIQPTKTVGFKISTTLREEIRKN